MKLYDKLPSAAASSDTGRKRKHNEDSWLIKTDFDTPGKNNKKCLYMVADGVGGAAAGEIASSMAVETIAKIYFEDSKREAQELLSSAIQQAHEAINRTTLENPQYKGMASTITALALNADKAIIAQVGDSRAYLIRNDKIQQLTADQTVVADLLGRGLINEEEARNHPQRHVLLQALGGGGAPPEPQVTELNIQPEDRLVLCTDGLYNLVKDEEIKSAALQKVLQSSVLSLVRLANDRGGTDNITVILVHIEKKGFYWSLQNRLAMILSKFAAVFG